MTVALYIVAVATFLVYIYKYCTYRPAKNYAPGPIRLPIFGSYLHIIREHPERPHVAFEKLTQKYNSPIIGLYIGDIYTMVVNRYEIAREIFNKPELQGRVDSFSSNFRTFNKKLGLFSDDGERWQHMKRFTMTKLRDFGFGKRCDTFEGVMEEEVRDFVESMRIECEAGRSVVVPNFFYAPLLNGVFYVVTGQRFSFAERETLQNLGAASLSFVTSTNITGRFLGVMPWLRFFFPERCGFKVLKTASDVFENIVRKHYEEHRTNFDENAVRDMIDTFLKFKGHYPNFTDEQLLITTIDLVLPIAAVGTALTYSVLHLIKYPEVFKKCRAQIDTVVGRDRLPNLNDRIDVSMVEATLREVMRKQTLTPLGLGHRATEDTTLGGYDVPKETFVVYNLWNMHMDKKVWGDPENFRPERFLDENGKFCARKDFSLPFGINKRVCMGETYVRQILFLLLAALIQNFDFLADTPIDLDRYRAGISIAPEAGFRVRFSPRA